MKVLLGTTDVRVSADVRAALGSDVFEVRTPSRALQQVDEAGPFDVAVIDSDTAPSGGLGFVHELRAREQMGQPVPPVVLLIAREQDRWLTRWAKPDASVLKPVDPFDLQDLVMALVEGRPVPTLPGVSIHSPAQSPDGEDLGEGVAAASMWTSGP